MSDPGLLQHLSDLAASFPESAAHRAAFQDLGSEFVYASPLRATDLRDLSGVWIVLVRFGVTIETLLGLTREVLLVYSPHSDLQIRTFEALRTILSSHVPREVTKGLALVCTPDPRQEQKLRDWSTARFTAVPVPYDLRDASQPDQAILTNLQHQLFTRDLYAQTSPVTGAAFFGRQILTQALAADTRDRTVFGVFGLRKSGKTSMLRHLQEVVTQDAKSVAFVIRDLESLPSLPDPVIPPLLLELHESLRAELKRLGLRTKELADVRDPTDLLAFKRGLQTLLRKLQPDGVQVIVALDEIEYLCPPDQSDVVTPETQAITQFFGVLRSLVQESTNFTFAVSGLASGVLETGVLFGRPNPLFSWAKVYYVRPFAREEASALLTTLGSQMGIRWDEGAIDASVEVSGGHAYLLRDFASRLASNLPLSVTQRVITRGLVHKVASSWRRAVAGNIQEMLLHVDRYYSTERWLLELLLVGDEDAQELLETEPQALNHLLELGLAEDHGNGDIRPSTLLAPPTGRQ